MRAMRDWSNKKAEPVRHSYPRYSTYSPGSEVWIKVCNSHSQSLNGEKNGAEAPQRCLKSEIKKKFAVLHFFNRRTKHYLTSLNILNNPKVAAAIKVWLEQSIKS